MVQAAPIAQVYSPEAPAPVCAHHWVIQPADGPMSNGTCQICGESRDFNNYVETATWGDTRLSNRNAVPAVGEFLNVGIDKFEDE